MRNIGWHPDMRKIWIHSMISFWWSRNLDKVELCIVLLFGNIANLVVMDTTKLCWHSGRGKDWTQTFTSPFEVYNIMTKYSCVYLATYCRSYWSKIIRRQSNRNEIYKFTSLWNSRIVDNTVLCCVARLCHSYGRLRQYADWHSEV